MRIEEFDLDLPQVSRSERIAFRRRTRCVSSLYEHCFDAEAISSPGWKVLVECVDAVKRPEVRNLEGVLTLEFAVDQAAYWQGSDLDQRRMALDWLVGGAVSVAREFGWNDRVFRDASRRVRDLKFKNERWLERPKWSASRKHKADVWYCHGSEAFRAWIVVTNREGLEIARKLLVEEIPDEFVFAPSLGSIRWDSDSRVSLMDKERQRVGYLDLTT